MELKIDNSPEPSACETCRRATTAHYLIKKVGRDDQYVCEHCIGEEINKTNDGLFGLSEWHNNRRELSKSELIQVIETEFIRDSGSIRYGYPTPSRLVSEFDHREKIEDLLDEERLGLTTIGVDDADAVYPPAERRLELIQTYDLFNKWDARHERKQYIREDIEEDLGEPLPI